jgi:hypothetical protein
MVTETEYVDIPRSVVGVYSLTDRSLFTEHLRLPESIAKYRRPNAGQVYGDGGPQANTDTAYGSSGV